ncbi:hypothetical protein [Pontibacter burrus]|uniref:Uncharacterized protein n=1 Tax=Pontibacter burrus TaxID=2704466 RepID=A0A6B3LUL5_9BACT|nr:hypothetical protein [Pontibacter burrus]NEM97678.1 hypothetical protein [Pontibacter burrus]
MRTAFILLICFWVVGPCLAQKLTYKQLMHFSTADKGAIGKKLNKRNWSFQSDNEPETSLLGRTIWAYGVTAERAEAWCVLYYSDTTPNRILYNFGGEQINRKLLRKIRSRSSAVIAEGNALPRVENVHRFTDYADDKYVYRYIIYNQSGWYGVKIFGKSDYELASRNGRL